jgi:hypothetical protein
VAARPRAVAPVAVLRRKLGSGEMLGEARVGDLVLPEAHARARLDNCGGWGGGDGQIHHIDRIACQLPAARLSLPAPHPPRHRHPQCNPPGPKQTRNRSQPWQSRARNWRQAAESVTSAHVRRKTAPSTGPATTVVRAQASIVSWEAHPRRRTVQSRSSDRSTWGEKGRGDGACARCRSRGSKRLLRVPVGQVAPGGLWEGSKAKSPGGHSRRHKNRHSWRGPRHTP